MTAATLHRIEGLTAEREKAADTLRRAADTLETARETFRTGTGSQTALEAAESRHRAAVGVHSQVVADWQNATDERRIADHAQSVKKLKTDAQKLHGTAFGNLSTALERAFHADEQCIRRRVETASQMADTRRAYSQVEQLAEEYARATGLLAPDASELECANTREKVMRESWNIEVSPPPFSGLPPIHWPISLQVESELANYAFGTRMAAPTLARLGGLK